MQRIAHAKILMVEEGGNENVQTTKYWSFTVPGLRIHTDRATGDHIDHRAVDLHSAARPAVGQAAGQDPYLRGPTATARYRVDGVCHGGPGGILPAAVFRVGSRVWDTSTPGGWGIEPDGRVLWKEISGGNPLEVMFSPFVPTKDLIREDPNDEWTKYYLKTSVSYEIGYSLYLTLSDENYSVHGEPGYQDFTNSGNPDLTGDGIFNGPFRPGDSDALILGDSTWADTRQCDLSVFVVCGASHSTRIGPGGGVEKFLEGDYVFGDGHVETRNSLTCSIRRSDGNTGWY